MSGHTLRVFLHRDTACVRAVCHEPDEASCRMQCQANCEDFCANPEEHIKPGGHCGAVEWMDLDGTAECYAGDDDEIPLHDGMAIEVTWDGERYVWSVAR
jgi:hypothetical protein